jgi:hypothetical protein
LLTANIRFHPGDDFRGRYLGMSKTTPLETGVFPRTTALAVALMKSAYHHVIEFGNDLIIQGPRFFDIPVAVEVNRISTPMSAFFQSFLLVNDGESERIGRTHWRG